MKFSISAAVAGLAAIACTDAYKVTGGSVSSKKVEIAKLDVFSSTLPSIPIESSRDSFLVTVNLEETKKPSQLLLLLSGKDGLEHSIYARFVDTEAKASASLVVSKLPTALKIQKEIKISLVAASASENEENIVVPLFTLAPTELFLASIEYEKPTRLGASPEIHHQFRSDQPTIGTSVPTIFSAGAVGLLVVLLGSWATLLNGDMFNGWLGSVYKLGYLATLGYFEYIVLQYYLGTSIFATIFQAAVILAPMSFFGSRALTSLARLRK